MQSETTTAITVVKQEVRLREWAEQLEVHHAKNSAFLQSLCVDYSPSSEHSDSPCMS